MFSIVVAACGTAGLEGETDIGSPAAEQALPEDPDESADSETAPDLDVRSKGSPDAPVTIVEYSDFQCPYCSRWVEQTYPAIERFIDEGKVRLVFRDFPLNFHPNADEAAIASRCAGEQDAYWEMHDTLFAQQQEWADLADAQETFVGYAGELGLDADSFDQCLNSGKYDEALQEDMAAGQAAGVSGTPSFVINGQLLVGAQPSQVFEQAIETVLNGGQLDTGQPQAQAPQEAPQPVDIPIEGAPVKGDPDAPITIVEYSDYQCPFCARFVVQTMDGLIQEFVDSGKAKIVFKDFPLNSIHPQAQKAAEAARCVRELAGGDEAYWAMHDALFQGQQDWAGQDNAEEIFAAYAEDIGVNGSDFETCLDSGRYASAVEADFSEGVGLGVRGTPTFFINGQSFVGAQPLQNFQQAIAVVEQGGNIQPPTPPTPAPTPTPAPLTEEIPLEDAAGIKGDPDAPITIVEYSDYQCPFCQRHVQQVMPKLQRYVDDGQVKYVFKDFPLTSIHPQAPKAAEAARCAGEQEAYWPMHDRLFQEQQAWSNNPSAVDIFKGYAGELNLDQASFDACLDGGKYAAAVDANQQEGIGYGVRGTPGFFINGIPVFGAYPLETFQAIIESELEK
jgi:protein-disulfide isomerase